MTKLIIINGPLHGEEHDFNLETKDGDIINTPNMVSKIRKYPEDAAIKFAQCSFKHQYQVFGKYAYYLGESIIERF